MDRKINVSKDIEENPFLVADDYHCFPAKPKSGMSYYLLNVMTTLLRISWIKGDGKQWKRKT